MAGAHQKICQSFARLLSYPSAEIKLEAVGCLRQLKTTSPQAAAAFTGFIDFLERANFSRIEEVYTATFDLQALCQPYVGYQLCGENQPRTLFLMKLQEIYRQRNFSAGSELPDHLSVLLRYIATVDEPDGHRDIIADALLPSLRKMLEGFESQDQPYWHLLTALQGHLTLITDSVPPEPERQKELPHG